SRSSILFPHTLGRSRPSRRQSHPAAWFRPLRPPVIQPCPLRFQALIRPARALIQPALELIRPARAPIRQERV
ncbi:MAG TPA: hypothetical protein VFJ58_25745, partial [Armatimonadota bacterium]|nr:hypothetical protein [Armatimonadota bacterium]